MADLIAFYKFHKMGHSSKQIWKKNDNNLFARYTLTCEHVGKSIEYRSIVFKFYDYQEYAGGLHCLREGVHKSMWEDMLWYCPGET